MTAFQILSCLLALACVAGGVVFVWIQNAPERRSRRNWEAEKKDDQETQERDENPAPAKKAVRKKSQAR